MFKNKEEQFDFYWKEIFDGLAYNPIEFNTYRFDQTMSLPGKVNKLYELFKVLAMNNQEVMDYLKEFVETFDFKLETTIKDILIVWLNEGLLADVVREAINEEVVEARTDYLDHTYLDLKERLDLEREEVILARDGSSTLRERLDNERDEVIAQIAKNTQQLKDIDVVNGDSFPLQVPETDDTARLQRAINHTFETTGIQTGKVNLGNKTYTITGLTIPRGIHLYGTGVLVLKGNGSIGLNYSSTLYTITEGITILLTDRNQVGINIDLNSQLNTFRNILVEGDNKANTTALKLGATWVNSFYDCKFFRASYGVDFTDGNSNANIFYNCEVRHLNTNINSKIGVIHRAGQNNAFKGGVIENYVEAVDVQGGVLTLDNVYTEGFSSGRPFKLSGTGTLIFINSLIKGNVTISGGKLLSFTNCDISTIRTATKAYPFIEFTADVPTAVRMIDNIVHDTFYHASFGKYSNGTSLLNRSPNNVNEFYQDRRGQVICSFERIDNISGDGTVYTAPLIPTKDAYVQINEGLFYPKDSGEFKVHVKIRLRFISEASHSVAYFRIREVGSGSVIRTSPYYASINADELGYMIMETDEFFQSNGLPIRIEVVVTGTVKNIQLSDGYCIIERLA